MSAIKVVVTGPFAAGKTTLIRTISEIAVVSTERGITDHTKEQKDETTVAMDFGRITIDPSLVLYLFGTPGQERFEFMWEILSEGMLGFILMVDAQREDSLNEAATMLETFRSYREVPFVVGVNKTDSEKAIAKARTKLKVPVDIPVLPVDAREKESVKELLLELLYSVLARSEEIPAGV